ncbi:hypothetical protein [Aeoliella mucimassa]|uniref:Carboxypeptidase regulatory-like domain-containing protein n=1 Tax=Aeoliella mucimassa TaxID=2527972 RepID=A0A518AIE1_9BACT|nr:hypothetical protein [Aeoliella mucimassa]QDU54492.1 hypothetical protein Pan181_06740 [Aeoliella mucimassa]
MVSSKFRCLLPFAFLVLAVGCDSTPDGQLKVYPTSGKVLVNDQPAEGVKIVLYGNSADLQGTGTPAPYGVTNPQGEFVLTSYEYEDGSPAGEFKVTAIWPAPIPEGEDEEMYQPEDKLQEKYVSSETTPLTITVPKGGGELETIHLEN